MIGANFHREQGIETLVICQSTEAYDIVEPTGTVLMGHHYFEWLCTFIKVIYLYLSKCLFYLINAVYLLFSVGQ